MIVAFGDKILVRIVEKAKKDGVLIVPKEQKEFQVGQIVSIGAELCYEGCPDIGIVEGDFVYTRKYAGLVVEYDDVEYVSLDPKEILAYSKELK